MVDDALLTEQLDYYRARAGEYDRWWNREGRFDRGAEANARWFAEAASLEGVLERFDPHGDVLELACGTGLWTRHLVRYASTLTAVDGSAEVLAINRARLGENRVRHIQADLFDWTPPGSYDACVFAFWLSHVPPSRLDTWLATVLCDVRPGGSLVIVDEYAPALEDEQIALADIYARRPLEDGRTFTIVKVFYDLADLQARLTHLAHQGVDAVTHKLDDRFFLQQKGKAAPIHGLRLAVRGY